MVLKFAANPDKVEEAVLPPVKLPLVEMLPVLKLISLPDFVQSELSLSQTGDADVPVFT